MNFAKNTHVTYSFLSFLFDRILRQFLNNKYSLKDRLTTVKKDVRYFKFPFLGHHSYVIRKRLRAVLKHTFPQIDFRIIFTNDFTVGSVLQKSKEKQFNLTSNVVYMFSCPCCTARYIGSCTRWLAHRCREHAGFSVRTSFPLTHYIPLSSFEDT